MTTTLNAYECDYTLLTANDDGIRTEVPHVIYIHTFEGRDLDAVAMARYQLSPAAGGSYHIVIDVDGKAARAVSYTHLTLPTNREV